MGSAQAEPTAVVQGYRTLPCRVEVWCPVIALFEGVLSDDLLREVAGRDLCGPVSLLHMADPTGSRDKYLLFLAERGRAPFALVKWARGPWADGVAGGQAAMRQVRASADR